LVVVDDGTGTIVRRRVRGRRRVWALRGSATLRDGRVVRLRATQLDGPGSRSSMATAGSAWASP